MNPLRVFVVDDDVDFALSLADVLRDENYYVECVHTGEEAVTRLQHEDFDIVLLDVRLPGINGVEVFFEIRNSRPGLKVIMMTGCSVADLLAQAVEGGVHGVFYKPFELDNLLAILAATSTSGLVLVLHDDPDFARSVKEILTDDGYSVLVANSRPEAVEKMVADEIDFLILDLRLPVMSGLEVYWELKNRGHTVPTVIVTACPKEEAVTVETLNQYPICGYFIKPFKLQEPFGPIKLIRNDEKAIIIEFPAVCDESIQFTYYDNEFFYPKIKMVVEKDGSAIVTPNLNKMLLKN